MRLRVGHPLGTAALIFLIHPAVLASGRLTTVALGIGTAAGVSEERIFHRAGGTPLLNNRGGVAFWGMLPEDVDGERRSGLFSDHPSTGLRLVAEHGGRVPGALDNARLNFRSGSLAADTLSFNDLGQVAFASHLETSLFGPTQTGILSEGNGSLNLVVRDGDRLPGSPERFVRFAYLSGLSNSGALLLSIDEVNDIHSTDDERAYWAADPSGELSVVTRPGLSAPGLEPGVEISDPFARINRSGGLSITSYLTGAGVVNDIGTWVRPPDAVALEPVARRDDLAPGFGPEVTLSYIDSYLTSGGQIISFAAITGPDVTPRVDNSLIYRAADLDSEPTVIHRSGSQVAGFPDGVIDKIFGLGYGFNRYGMVAVAASVEGPGITTANDEAFFRESADGGFQLVAREGDRAPGTPDGFVFDAFVSPTGENAFVHNAEGRMAFLANLIGPGVTSSTDTGILAEGLDGQLKLVVREGSLLDVSDDPLVTDFRTVRSLLFAGGRQGTGNDDGEQSGFNDRGQVAFYARFDDGSEGVFVSDSVAGLAGDFNGNGIVDAADYTVWRDGLDTTFTPGDYDVWAGNFGAKYSPSSASVPEAATGVLLLLGSLGYCTLRLR